MENLPLGSGERLKLRNNGELDVCFLGVGAAFTTTLYQNNYLIVKGDDHVLVDFGMTGPAAIRALGLEPTDVEVVLPTHSHSDHVGGFECLALMNRFHARPKLGKPKLKAILTETYEKVLWKCTLRGGLEWNEINPETGHGLAFADFFDTLRPSLKTRHPRETLEVDVGGIHLELFRTNHLSDPTGIWKSPFISYGLFIDGHVFVSGDTQFDQNLIETYADPSSAMFHDVQFIRGGVHAALSELRALPEAVRRKMHLMHYTDDWRKHDVSDFAGLVTERTVYRFR